MLRLAIARYSAPSRLALDAHDSPRKPPFITFRGIEAPTNWQIGTLIEWAFYKVKLRGGLKIEHTRGGIRETIAGARFDKKVGLF